MAKRDGGVGENCVSQASIQAMAGLYLNTAIKNNGAALMSSATINYCDVFLTYIM